MGSSIESWLGGKGSLSFFKLLNSLSQKLLGIILRNYLIEAECTYSMTHGVKSAVWWGWQKHSLGPCIVTESSHLPFWNQSSNSSRGTTGLVSTDIKFCQFYGFL